MYSTYSNPFQTHSYGELILDDCNVWDYDFPLTADEYENAVNEMISVAEAQHELDFHNYHSC